MAQAYRSLRSVLASTAALLSAVHVRAQQRRRDRQHADCECHRGPSLSI